MRVRARLLLLFGLAAGVVFLLTRLSSRSLPVRVLVAAVLGVVIVAAGRRVLLGFGAAPRERREGAPEEVGELDVYFVCGECGTEYKVTKLGELSVPRHCGEPMEVVRRPAQDPTLN